jgi:hypothetical protein
MYVHADLMNNKLFKSKLGWLFTRVYLCAFGLVLILNVIGPTDGLGGLLLIAFGAPWVFMIVEALDALGITPPPIISVCLFPSCILLNAALFYALGVLLSRIYLWITRIPKAN